MAGLPLSGAQDPFERACAQAALGCDAGLVAYNLGADTLRAALVLAPEVPLRAAMAMLPTCGVGFQNALGALAPPEVAVHLEWGGAIRVNGASCGRLRAAASSADPEAVPDWLVIGLEVSWMPPDPEAPGATPDATGLIAEGCAELDPGHLLESWARHTLVWINRIEDVDASGRAALHTDWRALAHGLGEEIVQPWRGEALSGTFLGVDEDFGMLLRQGTETRLLPLTGLLEENT
ncbi:biotin/lipoate--protein ligase family protein [Pseudoruegeria aquimaris]|nr:biotin/lipoate--protein ligase family protein [Pseudoruegeria aquimaris]